MPRAAYDEVRLKHPKAEHDDVSPTLSPREARAGRIVQGGAIRRILWISVGLAMIALAATYFFMTA